MAEFNYITFKGDETMTSSSTKKVKGIVYTLTNPLFPKYVKIGCVTSLNPDAVRKRMLALNTSVPEDFEWHYAMRVFDDVRGAEKIMHNLFRPAHVCREFFKIKPSQARAAMELALMQCRIIYHIKDPDKFNVEGYAPAKADQSSRLKKKVKNKCATSACGNYARTNQAQKSMTHCEKCAQLAASRSQDWHKKNRAAVGAKRKPKS